MEGLFNYFSIFATVGLINGLFTLFFVNSNKTIPNNSILFLNLLIIALILKIIFCFSFIAQTTSTVLAEMIRYASYYGYLCFGPLLYLYYKKWLNKEFRFHHKHFVFFLIPVLLLILLSQRPNKLLYFQIFNLIFFVATFFYIQKYLYEKNHNVINKRWGLSLFIGFVLIWLSANLLFIDFDLYIIEFTILLTFNFYFLIYYASANYWVKKSIYYTSKKSNGEHLNKTIIQKATETLERNKVYKNPDLSLPKLARLINISPHKLSEAINAEKNVNFNEFINTFRIEAIAKDLLKNNGYTIASIAYDNGFNSISTFNTNFRKITNHTPSGYINKYKH